MHRDRDREQIGRDYLPDEVQQFRVVARSDIQRLGREMFATSKIRRSTYIRGSRCSSSLPSSSNSDER